MQPRQAAYLLDIFNSVKAIQSYTAGYSRENFSRTAKRRMPSCGGCSLPERRLPA